MKKRVEIMRQVTCFVIDVSGLFTISIVAKGRAALLISGAACDQVGEFVTSARWSHAISQAVRVRALIFYISLLLCVYKLQKYSDLCDF